VFVSLDSCGTLGPFVAGNYDVVAGVDVVNVIGNYL
jgi:hypothetical protein